MSTSTITNITSSTTIDDSVSIFNDNYFTIFGVLTSVQVSYGSLLKPIYNFYNNFALRMQNAYTIYQSNSANWNDFLTTTKTYSAKWIQPFSIFYPILIEDPITNDNINTVNDWVRKYYPIKNQDGTLNYIENQKIIVSCYTYTESKTIGSAAIGGYITFPYTLNLISQCFCTTADGTITANCATNVSGQPICENAVYTCGSSKDCNQSKTVGCWYTSPYLDSSGNPIPDKNTSVQNAISRIQANLSFDYTDRSEKNLINLVFIVNNCDWSYLGENI
jgi:hypothetical protein